MDLDHEDLELEAKQKEKDSGKAVDSQAETTSEIPKKPGVPKAIVVAVVIALTLFGWGQMRRHERIAHDQKQEVVDKMKKKTEQEVAGKIDEAKTQMHNAMVRNDAHIDSSNKPVEVQNSKYVALTDLALKGDQYDQAMDYAINNIDPDKVNNLLQSGIKVPFTSNAICVLDDPKMPHVGDASVVMGGTSYPMPQDVPAMEKFLQDEYYLMKFSDNYPIEDACQRRFLMIAGDAIKKKYVRGDSFKFYNPPLLNSSHPGLNAQQQEEANTVEDKRLQIFNTIRSQTPEQDYVYYSLLAQKQNLPYDVRISLIEDFLKYWNDKDNLPLDPKREQFLKVYKQALTEIYNNPNNNKNKIIGDLKWKLENMPTALFISVSNELVDDIAAYNNYVISRQTYFVNDKPIEITKQVIHEGLNFSVDSQSGYYKGLQENGYLTLYELQQTIKMYNILLNSKAINLDAQDAQGRTILHNLVLKGNYAAPVIRDLLEHGANPNLVDAGGTSPYKLALDKNSKSNTNTVITNGVVNDDVIKAFDQKQFK